MGVDKQPLHILTKAGVLASFSISKKITEAEVNSMMSDAKSEGKSQDEVVDLVKTKLMKEIIDATKKGTLPGIILEKAQKQIISVKNIESLNHMVLILSQKMKAKKFDKNSLCYFINYLVTSLGLTEEDFEDFHRKMKELQGEDDDDDE